MSEERGEPACWLNNVCDLCDSLTADASLPSPDLGALGHVDRR